MLSYNKTEKLLSSGVQQVHAPVKLDGVNFFTFAHRQLLESPPS